MTIPRFIPALVFLAAFAGLSQASPAANPVSNTKKSAAPVAHARTGAAPSKTISDPDLERAIKARFARSKISTDKFTAHVQGGVATLEGKTDVIQHKGTATRLAKTTGALAVVNHIQISDAAREKAADNLSKGRRRAQVKRGDVVARTEVR